MKDGGKKVSGDKLEGKIVVSVPEVEELLGISRKGALGLINIIGRGHNPGQPIQSFVDPVTGETMYSAAAIRELLRNRERREAEEAVVAEVAAKVEHLVRRELEQYVDGPAVYTLREFCELTGMNRDYVRTGVQLGRVPGAVIDGRTYISGPFTRWRADEVKRAKKQAAAAEEADRQVPPQDDGPAWVPIDTVCERLGLRRDAFRLGESRGGLEVRRVNGSLMVSGPAFRAFVRNNPKPREDA